MTELRLITGRTRKPLSKKLNPIWWFQNDDEERTAPWYKPEWPQWRRDFYWNFLRNPLQNFRCYVVGVQDRNYSVWGRKPVMTVQRNDLQPPKLGCQWCVLAVGPLRLPFVSYSGRRVLWYAGWQPSGFFGGKFNLHRSARVMPSTRHHPADARRLSPGRPQGDRDGDAEPARGSCWFYWSRGK